MGLRELPLPQAGDPQSAFPLHPPPPRAGHKLQPERGPLDARIQKPLPGAALPRLRAAIQRRARPKLAALEVGVRLTAASVAKSDLYSSRTSRGSRRAT